MNIPKSSQLFEKTKQVIPGGVNSPVRAFGSVGSIPPVIKEAAGSRIRDIDGNEYIDFVASWGPLILGHAHPAVVEAVKKAAEKGTSYGAPTENEYELAKMIVDMVPSVEMVRFVNSGTEATMSAVRLARAYTKKDKIIKFAGCYHGHGDSFLINAGSGAMTLSIPGSPGVTKNTAQDTLIAKYNDLSSVESLFSNYNEKIAAIIVEPVAGNMGVVPPVEGFLKGLRKMADNHNALLIFDEIITGFRLAKGGAQEYYEVSPDLTTFGKIIGGGFAVGAYGGKKEIMEMIAPAGNVYQAGTLSGNPVAMAAGKAMLNELKKDNFYHELENKSNYVAKQVKQAFQQLGIKGVVNRVGSMMAFFFNENEQVLNYDNAAKSDTNFFAQYMTALLERGIYIAPSQFECLFISYVHTNKDLQYFVNANFDVLKKLKR